MTLQKSPRIVWLAVGLSLIGWMFYLMPVEPACAAAPRNTLTPTPDQFGRLIVDGQAQIQMTLDESAAEPGENGAIPALAQLIRARLNGDATKLVSLNARCVAWRDSYDAVWDDISQQRTMNKVRTTINRLTGAVDEIEGQHRLEDAIRYRQWRNASSDDASLLATQILIDEGSEQSQRARIADVKTQLSELAKLAESLNGEQQFDGLTDLRDNQIKPILQKLSESMDVFRQDPANHDVLTPRAIEDLGSALFGSGYAFDETHQSIQAAPGGLFTLRWNALQLRRQRQDLRREANELFQEIEQSWTGVGPSTHGLGQVLAQARQRVFADNRQMWAGGWVCLVALLSLAILIRRGNRGRTMQKLTLEKQAAAAELDKAKKQLLELSRQAALADACTGLLHSVDEILNSVNVSANAIRDKVAQLRVGNLSKASAMIESHRADLANFLTVHEKGRQLPGYFTLVSKQLSQEHEAVVAELNNLVSGVEHIKQVVRSRQEPAKPPQCPST